MIVHTKILVVDENLETWEEIKPRLEKNSFDLLMTDSAEKALLLLQDTRIELVIVGSAVSDVDYLELIKQIKAEFYLSVIVVSEDHDVMDVVVGLEVGADDFIGKPFELRELVARIKANLRLVHETEERVLEKVKTGQDSGATVIEFGDWIMDRNKMCVLEQKNKNPVDLTAGEYRLLEALVLSGGKVLSRERLFELTRDEEFEAYDRAIDIQIARIRKKLNDDSKHPQFIKTVRGAGYMLDVSIKKTA